MDTSPELTSYTRAMGRRITAARLKAGFRSMSSAAKAVGMTAARLTDLEDRHGDFASTRLASTPRRPLPNTSELRAIARAFDVPLEDIVGPTSSLDPRRKNRTNQQFHQWIHDRRVRMLVARHMVGFPVLGDLAAHFGWRIDTVMNVMVTTATGRSLAIYAKATGTTAAWLQDGEGPSGYGDGVDAYVAAALPDGVDLAHPALRGVDRGRLAHPDDLDEVGRSTRPVVGLPPKVPEGDAATVRWALGVAGAFVDRLMDLKSDGLEAETLIGEVGALRDRLAARLADTAR